MLLDMIILPPVASIVAGPGAVALEGPRVGKVLTA